MLMDLQNFQYNERSVLHNKVTSPLSKEVVQLSPVVRIQPLYISLNLPSLELEGFIVSLPSVDRWETKKHGSTQIHEENP